MFFSFDAVLCYMARERKETDFLIAVGKKLREIRESKSYSQEYVYENTKINLDRVEKARTNYTLSTLYILCNFYGITLDEFFKGIK